MITRKKKLLVIHEVDKMNIAKLQNSKIQRLDNEHFNNELDMTKNEHLNNQLWKN